MISAADDNGGPSAPDDLDAVDRALAGLRARIDQLDHEGRGADAISLLMAEMDATKTLSGPKGEPFVIADHVRRLAAAKLYLEIDKSLPPPAP